MWLQFISDASFQAAICSPMVTASTPPNDLNFHKPSQNSTASQTGGPWTFRPICLLKALSLWSTFSDGFHETGDNEEVTLTQYSCTRHGVQSFTQIRS